MVAAGDGATVHFLGLPSWTTGGLMPVTVRQIPSSRCHSPHLPSHQIPLLHPGHPEASSPGQLSPSHVYPLPGFCRDQQEAMLPGSGERLGYRRGHLQMSHFLLKSIQKVASEGDICEVIPFYLPLLSPSFWHHSHQTCAMGVPLCWASYLSHRSGEACRSWRPFSSHLTPPEKSQAMGQPCCLSHPDKHTSFISRLANRFSISLIRSSISRITSSRVSASTTALRISESKSWDTVSNMRNYDQSMVTDLQS
jgi:hypothetical protein